MKIILLLLACAVVGYCQTRPQISPFFDSNVLLEIIVLKDNSSFRGDGFWRMDQPKGMGLEQFFFHNRSHHSAFRDIMRLQRYDLGFIYEMVDDLHCNKSAVSGSMPYEWAWLANATYEGKKQFRHMTFDEWQFTAGYATVAILVDNNNPNIPAFMRRTTNEFDFLMEFARFKPIHPDPKSFTVPSQCQSAMEFHHEGDVGCVQRNTMMSRAQSWVNAHVPYNQGGTYGGYREDCSGYVSMCWETSKPGYTTETMPSISHGISRGDLQPGDALLCASEHVVLFGGWVDSDNYWGYEETVPGTGTIKSSVPYPYWYNTGCFLPYRYNSVC